MYVCGICVCTWECVYVMYGYMCACVCVFVCMLCVYNFLSETVMLKQEFIRKLLV